MNILLAIWLGTGFLGFAVHMIKWIQKYTFMPNTMAILLGLLICLAFGPISLYGAIEEKKPFDL